ncbi:MULTISPECIES: tail fiber assembly protein [Xenorhabdus]|uniref:tail fiber assembly protein n=1 Tax=Xenorhabdus TaxID=626 RepID=UPI0006471635|nr:MULTISPECIES: tail fiber assembly protein [Xenorhabdus]
MKYYKDKHGQVYAYKADGSQDRLIKPGLTPITEDEVDILTNPPPTPAQLQQQSEHEKQYWMGVAKDKIAPLQDAVDLNMATDEEKSALIVWRKYRVLLNRVDCSTAPDIDWPEQPE